VKSLGAALALLLAVSCATQRPASSAQPSVTPEPASVVPPAPETVRTPPAPPWNTTSEHSEPVWSPPTEWPRVTAPDASLWPSGWVEDAEGPQFGLPERFWTEQRPLWLEALSGAPAPAAFRLGKIYRNAPADEAFRAAWRLWLIHSRAGLGEQARSWLDKAFALKPEPRLELERAWDQAFRLRDLWGARALWAEAGSAATDAKFRLLRQKLFLGTKSLVPLGADDYVSSIELDRDDLWAATWDGAIVRWSLVTNDVDLIRAAGETVSPIRCLAVTGWFVYAFQDKNLLRYSKVAGTWRTFPYPAGWNGLRVQGVVADGQETLWVGHLGEGLWRWDRGNWTLVDAAGGGPFINALASDGHGGLWIGTKDRGLWSWSAGVWSPVTSNGVPSNISVIEPSPDGSRWAVGSWGEGTWLLSGGTLKRADGSGSEYVTSAAWTSGGPIWGTLDQGVLGAARRLGPLDGAPADVSALAVWQDRWLWGSSQGLGWWSEDENTALSR